MKNVSMGIDVSHVDAETPTVSYMWRKLTEQRRINILQPLFINGVKIKGAKDNGDVIVEIKPLPVDERGPYLLEMEEYLKTSMDHGITVWLEPASDKNTLRHLRGVELKL